MNNLSRSKGQKQLSIHDCRYTQTKKVKKGVILTRFYCGAKEERVRARARGVQEEPFPARNDCYKPARYTSCHSEHTGETRDTDWYMYSARSEFTPAR